jgi:hypothetical protein
MIDLDKLSDRQLKALEQEFKRIKNDEEDDE